MPKNKNITNHQGKKYWPIFIVVAVVLIVGGFFLLRKPEEKNIRQSQCQVQEITFYYLETCEWCNKVKGEGTIEKIEKLGIKVKKINAAVGPVRHKFEGVPTFVIDEKIYTGYRTFEELKEFLGCPTDSKQGLETQNQIPSPIQTEKAFFGEKGEKVVLENGEVKLDAAQFSDNKARFYNIEMPNGKIIHFFVIKDRKGIYRAAADACQVCFTERKGFHQEGDEIVCNNCGNRYPIEKIATEKGGCNPGPINPNLEIKNSQIIIEQADIEQVADLF
ncbi:MAG: Fe-S-containing protein [bacterium]|nr:Fe-S-containing protein [bacterium]